MRISRDISRFLNCQSGAVTVDWVVLTAGVVGLGLVMIQAVGPSANTLADDTSKRYEQSRITLEK